MRWTGFEAGQTRFSARLIFLTQLLRRSSPILPTQTVELVRSTYVANHVRAFHALAPVNGVRRLIGLRHRNPKGWKRPCR